MHKKSVLLIGDYDHREFRETVAWLADSTQLLLAENPDAGQGCLAEGYLPHAVVIAQSRPGQYAAEQVERLHAISPMSRLVALLGSWCEGEMRTGRPWPGVIRVMWHQWRPRLIPQLSDCACVRPELWNLPRTASVTEQMTRAIEVVWPRQSGLIAIYANTYRDYQAIAVPSADVGYATHWVCPDRPVHATGVTASIVEDVAATDASLDRLAEVVKNTAPGPVIAVLDYVRRQDYERALSVGVSAVVAKPLLMYDVLWHLNDLLDTPQMDGSGQNAPRPARSVTPAA
jgi:hypothetical protein